MTDNPHTDHFEVALEIIEEWTTREPLAIAQVHATLAVARAIDDLTAQLGALR